MNKVSVQSQSQKIADAVADAKAEQEKKPVWETPKMEDVSEQVMAQPYIRFT